MTANPPANTEAERYEAATRPGFVEEVEKNGATQARAHTVVTLTYFALTYSPSLTSLRRGPSLTSPSLSQSCVKIAGSQLPPPIRHSAQ